jgi:hypothetical protein
MRNSKMLKGITTMVAAVCMMMLMTATVFAASKDLIKDGAFAGTGFIIESTWALLSPYIP